MAKNSNELITITNIGSGILQINLNRPEYLNALNRAILQHLSELFHQAKHDPTIKALLLTGEGKAFCAGADIKELALLNGQQGLEFARFGQAVFRQLELLGKPSLAAVQGVAFGGGCELAMAASLRLAATNTMFAQPEVKLGVIPGFGGTQRLARLIGKGRALELCLTGRRLSAEDAYHWGLVNEITSAETLIVRSKALLQGLVELGSIALQSILTTIHQGYDLSLEEAMELEAAHFALCCDTQDKHEGVAAFLEKRPAVFSGV